MTFVDRERFQEINRKYAEAGLPVVMPDDWATITSMANQIAASDAMTAGELDRDPDGQSLAQETVTNHRIAVGMDYPEAGVLRKSGSTEIAEHDGPQIDLTNPATQNRLYAILAGLPDSLIPLSANYTVTDVIEKRLKFYRDCNIRISRGCKPTSATQREVIKCGEFVCIYATCTECKDWFKLDSSDRRTTQARPLVGFDFRGSIFRRSDQTSSPENGDLWP